MKKLATIILLSLLSHFCYAADNTSPKREIRAVWLTTLGGLDWPKTYATSNASVRRQKEELTDILDKLHDAGINSVLFQVRTRSAVLYPSKYEPWAPCLSGSFNKSPGYDPLAFAIEECHKRGMELHAWVTTIPAGRWNSKECRRLRSKLGNVIKRNGDQGYMNPESGKTAYYLSDLCREITSKYDVDGIHLDYIRYPEDIRLRISKTEARSEITDIVRKIYHGVKQIKPWVKISCSPIGKYADLSRYSSRGWNARDRVCQDAQAWLSEGIMDILFPMMYFRNEHFYPFLFDWTENKHNGDIASGIAAYMLSPREGNWSLDDVTRQMYVSRRQNAGFAFFRSKFLTENVKGIYNFTKETFNLHPALMPVTYSNGIKAPESPQNMTVRYSGDYYILNWDEGKWYDKSPYCTYNVYASHKYPVDTEDAQNLIRTRKTGREAVVRRSSKETYFAVTTTDRYGRESEPLQQCVNTASGDNGMMVCEGSRFDVGEVPSDVEFIIIETLYGNIVSTPSYSSNGIETGNIPPGMYVLRTLNRRGISHRIGFMLKK